MATDNFNRGDGGLGANWTHCATDNGFPPVISGNKVIGDGSGFKTRTRYTGASFANDQFSEAQRVDAVTFNTSVFIVVRSEGTFGTESGFAWRHDINSSISKTISISGGVETDIETGLYSPGATDYLRLEVTGSGSSVVLKGYADAFSPATTLRFTSPPQVSVGSGGGYPGIGSGPDGASFGWLDNWSGGDLGGGGGGALPFVTRLDAQRMRQQFARRLQRHGHDLRTLGMAA